MISLGMKLEIKFKKSRELYHKFSSETVTNEAKNIKHDKEILRKRYIFPEKGKNTIADLRLI